MSWMGHCQEGYKCRASNCECDCADCKPLRPPTPRDAGATGAYRAPFWPDCRLDGTYQVRSQDRTIYPCDTYEKAAKLAEHFNNAYAAGRAEERERCAKVAREFEYVTEFQIPDPRNVHNCREQIARAIEKGTP